MRSLPFSVRALLSIVLAGSLVACSSDPGSDTTGSAGAGGEPAGGAGGNGGAGGGSTSAAPVPTTPSQAFLPTATGPCPELAEGKITVTPDGKARDVEIWMSDAAKTLDGPLIFYWHGTGSSPIQEPPFGIGNTALQEILAQGGIVAAPHHDPDAGTFPWYLVLGEQEDDLRVADEVLACAIEKVGVDLRRIHSMGMSAGALHTTQMAYRRSGYLASVATYSGGQLSDIPNQDETNLFAAMIMHGGSSDNVVISFQKASETFHTKLNDLGHFSFLCNHGLGHKIPTDARDSVWRFFQDHPFGTVPSPYKSGLPATFPSYCAL